MRHSIDTNVLLRLLVTEEGGQNDRLLGLLETDLYVPITVVLETEWVLRKVLRTDAESVEALFRILLGFLNVVVGDRDALVVALDGLKRGMDFADALHQALSSQCASLLTFDKAFIRRATSSRRICLSSASPDGSNLHLLA